MVDRLEPGRHLEDLLPVGVQLGLLNLLKSPGLPLQLHKNELG